jgi:hypothetical protein
MTIKTKFNMKDKVWIMQNNRPTEKEVSYIRVKVGYDTINIYYKFGVTDNLEVNEHHLYETKEHLINSL